MIKTIFLALGVMCLVKHGYTYDLENVSILDLAEKCPDEFSYVEAAKKYIEKAACVGRQLAKDGKYGPALTSTGLFKKIDAVLKDMSDHECSAQHLDFSDELFAYMDAMGCVAKSIYDTMTQGGIDIPESHINGITEGSVEDLFAMSFSCIGETYQVATWELEKGLICVGKHLHMAGLPITRNSENNTDADILSGLWEISSICQNSDIEYMQAVLSLMGKTACLSESLALSVGESMNPSDMESVIKNVEDDFIDEIEKKVEDESPKDAAGELKEDPEKAAEILNKMEKNDSAKVDEIIDKLPEKEKDQIEKLVDVEKLDPCAKQEEKKLEDEPVKEAVEELKKEIELHPGQTADIIGELKKDDPEKYEEIEELLPDIFDVFLD
ncbi:hypothetical protein Ciccas_002784 [Cichlidogyrus casuarinus]|uniref:Uncharacterized protein n=1 Tax=Cichlidogyrus casuarinus TaxID=1844966 RepID=A0ABD2QG81_9PLAT